MQLDCTSQKALCIFARKMHRLRRMRGSAPTPPKPIGDMTDGERRDFFAVMRARTTARLAQIRTEDPSESGTDVQDSEADQHDGR